VAGAPSERAEDRTGPEPPAGHWPGCGASQSGWAPPTGCPSGTPTPPGQAVRTRLPGRRREGPRRTGWGPGRQGQRPLRQGLRRRGRSPDGSGGPCSWGRRCARRTTSSIGCRQADLAFRTHDAPQPPDRPVSSLRRNAPSWKRRIAGEQGVAQPPLRRGASPPLETGSPRNPLRARVACRRGVAPSWGVSGVWLRFRCEGGIPPLSRRGPHAARCERAQRAGAESRRAGG
jgi:hypothetical protein